ncbi:hypothetical protein STRDD11_00996 [Streptococcus sp. DD11]|nr:hypothetical protein STRDD11_00996 [Streptococcus sp. DD11]
MKRFSLPFYYLFFLIYLIGSFFLHLFLFGMVFSLMQGGSSGGLVGLIFGLYSFPLGLWNFLFFIFTPPVEQALKPQVWLGSVLGLPLLASPFLAYMIGSSVFNNDSPYMLYITSILLLFLLGMIVSNAIIYALAYAVKFLWKKKQAGKKA